MGEYLYKMGYQKERINTVNASFRHERSLVIE